jgi:hypothetical protein
VNLILPERFQEQIRRLVLGIEPVDALRDRRIGVPLRVSIDKSPPVLRLPWIDRHDSCRFAVTYRKEINQRISGPPPRPHVDIRITDVPRRWAPRRIRYPVLAEAVVDANPPEFRVRRPRLFPAAAYELPESATGIRGRVRRAGAAMRWARVEAVDPVSGIVVGRAHGDDRGEFLLVLAPEASPVGDLIDPLPLDVTVFGPNLAPGPPVPATLEQEDLLWDLPLEMAPAPGVADGVSDGVTAPPGYRASAGGAVSVRFDLGRLLTTTEVAPFVFT